MLLKIIDGCVETDKIYNIGEIIDCQDEVRAKRLIDEGYCVEVDKYEKMRYEDEQKSKESNIKNSDTKSQKQKSKEESLDDFRGKLNL